MNTFNAGNWKLQMRQDINDRWELFQLVVQILIFFCKKLSIEFPRTYYTPNILHCFQWKFN